MPGDFCRDNVNAWTFLAGGFTVTPDELSLAAAQMCPIVSKLT